MKTAFAVIFSALCFLTLFSPRGITGIVLAQTQFQRAIGGTALEYAYSMVQTADSGYAIAGSTSSSFGAGNNDSYIVKLNSSGSLQWTRTVGGAQSDVAMSIICTSDGGYAAAGYTGSFGAGSNDFYIVKLNSSGSVLWTKTIGGTGYDYAQSIIQTADGGYALAGYTTSFGAGSNDFYIVKLSSTGALQWSRTVGGAGGDVAYSIIQATDGGYALAGYTYSFGAGSYDMYIVKLNSSGTLLWSRTVGGASIEYAQDILETAEGGYAVSGFTMSYGAGANDFYIVKLDSSGALQWTRTVGGTGIDYGQSIIQTGDNGYAMTGWTVSYGAGDYDMFIVKLDRDGTLQWSRTAGGIGLEYSFSVIQTPDAGYAIAGTTYSFGAGLNDMYVVKFDSSGNTCGNSSSPSAISGSGGFLGTPTSYTTSPTSTVTTPTSITGTGGTLTAICTFVGIQPISNKIPDRFELCQNYPNPFNPSTKIKFDITLSPLSEKGAGGFVTLKIYDLLGRQVSVLVNEQLQSGSYEVEWDASNYPSGVYFYKITADQFTNVKKMILVK